MRWQPKQNGGLNSAVGGDLKLHPASGKSLGVAALAGPRVLCAHMGHSSNDKMVAQRGNKEGFDKTVS